MSGRCAGADHQLLLPPHPATTPQLYHVPQHSRREKLRFPPDVVDEPCLPHHAAHASHLLFLPQGEAGAVVGGPPHVFHYGGLVPSASAVPQSGDFSLALSSSPSPPPGSSSSNPRRSAACNGPFGPFTGYAAVLERSRFLEPAKQLLYEICDVAGRSASSMDDGGWVLDPDPDVSDQTPPALTDMDAGDRWKKTRLIAMMDEVCKRYKHYYQQVQAVISSFESVAGLGNAAPYASYALRSMTKHFKYLKSAIANQLVCTAGGKTAGGRNKVDDMPTLPGFDQSAAGLCLDQRSNIVAAAFAQPHVWRSQRGLPEPSVAVLRAWLFEHFLHPYPTDRDKALLAKQTGLSRNQVSNWFINARVRLWKPMVEEIHNLEMQQQSRSTPVEKSRSNRQQIHMLPHNNVGGDASESRPLPPASNADDNHNNFHPVPDQDHHLSSGIGHVGSTATGGVSLTLGLVDHQNYNGTLCLPTTTDTLPASLLHHRYGLDDAFGQLPHFMKDLAGSHMLS